MLSRKTVWQRWKVKNFSCFSTLQRSFPCVLPTALYRVILPACFSTACDKGKQQRWERRKELSNFRVSMNTWGVRLKLRLLGSAPRVSNTGSSVPHFGKHWMIVGMTKRVIYQPMQQPQTHSANVKDDRTLSNPQRGYCRGPPKNFSH